MVSIKFLEHTNLSKRFKLKIAKTTLASLRFRLSQSKRLEFPSLFVCLGAPILAEHKPVSSEDDLRRSGAGDFDEVAESDLASLPFLADYGWETEAPEGRTRREPSRKMP